MGKITLVPSHGKSSNNKDPDGTSNNVVCAQFPVSMISITGISAAPCVILALYGPRVESTGQHPTNQAAYEPIGSLPHGSVGVLGVAGWSVG